MNRPDLLALRDAVRANIQGGADLLSERRMLRLLDALLWEDNPIAGLIDFATVAVPTTHDTELLATLAPRDPLANWSA